ncbi:D-arabinono-1,4-lactone oxidase [Microbacterium marmarense]|uniref:D-arabinono-1,4-lactone oxidase n=1 Tax=Microbacterium marmarense TaxID=3122051 RepID=A0ABU8LW82_9MICO
MMRMGGVWQNWGRSEKVRPQAVEYPRTAEAVQRSVVAAGARGLRVKAIGASHSFTGIAVAPGVLLELVYLSGLVSVDADRSYVTLLAGTRLHQIPQLLAPYGLAMENLGDIDSQSISGAISTGTHGTGTRFGGIATQVVGVTLVTADGEVLVVNEQENTELLPAAALGLGALGVIVDVTVRCVPAFVLHAIEQPESLEHVLDEIDARVAATDHFEFYWFPHTDRAMTKTNTRLPADAPKHPLPRIGKWVDDVLVGTALHQVACSLTHLAPSTAPAINRLSVKLWGDREFTDSSDSVFATTRSVRFREMEYALPIENVRAAFEAVQALVRERRWRISFPVEVRFTQGDELWMSTAHGRASGYIAVHRYWRDDPAEYFDAVEQIMTEFGGRPHWGKMHTLDASVLRERYPRFDDFVAVRDRLDPDRMFHNPYLERVLGE